MEQYSKWLLRFEGGVVAALAIWFYATQLENWWLFAALILLPDISAIGYLANKRIGAICYNVTHSYISPVAVFGVLFFLGQKEIAYFMVVWIAHIGVDRFMGYGMKYDDNPKRTHLN